VISKERKQCNIAVANTRRIKNKKSNKAKANNFIFQKERKETRQEGAKTKEKHNPIIVLF